MAWISLPTESGTVHRIPIGAILSFWTGFLLTTLIFAALTAYLFYLRAVIQAGTLAVAWIMVMVVVVLPSLRAVRRVDVTSDGLTARTVLGFRRSVAWNEIATLREHKPNRIWRAYGLLDLVDLSGRVLAQLNSRLSGYQQLIGTIEHRVAPRSRPPASS